MDEFKSSDRGWSNATNRAYSICEKHGLAFNTNISEHHMWIRPAGSEMDIVYQEIRGALNYYKKNKLVEVKEPHRIFGESGEIVVEIVRK